MADIKASLPALGALLEQRLGLVRRLAESLEVSQSALLRNDAEAVARGAAHQAELCRQWSRLEDGLRCEASHNAAPPDETEHSARLQAEWDELGARIRHLTRVHWSLLRHMQRSLAVLQRVVESCAPTYTPGPGPLRPDAGWQAGE